MSEAAIGVVALVGLLAVLALRIPVAVAMLGVGGAGYVLLSGWDPLINYLKTAAYWRFSAYDLSVVPLFLLMGQFATRAGMGAALFRAARLWFGAFRGGMAMAAVGACAGFGAICGSSLATAATMGRVALPELKRYGYSDSLASGALAAGGTLGVLIPPSVVVVLYAVLVDANVATLFKAAFIPGALAAVGYLAAIAVQAALDPDAGPAGPKTILMDKIKGLGQVWTVVLIFIVVIGGIYSGKFTPTEGAAVGAFGVGILAVLKGGMRWEGLRESLLGAAEATGMIFLVLLGADLFNAFLALTGIPSTLAMLAGDSGWPPYLILAAILAAYVVLGCVLDSLSMVLLTVPVFWPVIAGLDFGMGVEDVKIWFGILALIVVEMGLITPPVGLNVFVIKNLIPGVPMGRIYRGVAPFLISDLVRIALLAAVPALTLWLPQVLK